MGIVIFVGILLIFMTIKYKNWKLLVYLFVVLAVYWKVGDELNDVVLKAHGWFSNNNGKEKVLASLWIYGFPFLTVFVPIWMMMNKVKKRDNIEQ